MAVETLGSWAPMGLDFIKDVGSRIADATGEKRWTSWLFQRMSVIIQQGNAACFLGTVPDSRKLHEIYDL